MNKLVTHVVVLVVGLLLALPAAAQQYYKWVDDEGVTHYSAEKPEEQDVSKVKADNPPSSSQGKAIDRLEQQRQQSEQQRKAQQRAEKQKEKEKENPQAVSKENCKQHRKNLETLNTRSVVRRKDSETGKQEALTDKERQAMIEKTKKALERCNKKNGD